MFCIYFFLRVCHWILKSLACVRRLFIGVERNALRPPLIAESREVLILFNCDLDACP